MVLLYAKLAQRCELLSAGRVAVKFFDLEKFLAPKIISCIF